jgi:hypothetical protein
MSSVTIFLTFKSNHAWVGYSIIENADITPYMLNPVWRCRYHKYCHTETCWTSDITFPQRVAKDNGKFCAHPFHCVSFSGAYAFFWLDCLSSSKKWQCKRSMWKTTYHSMICRKGTLRLSVNQWR